MKKSDLWKQLVEEVGEEEIERAACVTVAEAEAELAAAGFDVAAERARSEAFLDALANGSLDSAASAAVARDATPRSARQERRKGPPPMVVLLGTAAVAAAAGAAIYAATHPAPEHTTTPAPPTTTAAPTFVPSVGPPDLVVAADVRRQAGGDCDAQQWDDCLAHLDQARAADPAGDDAPAVKKLRDRAIGGILGKPKPK